MNFALSIQIRFHLIKWDGAVLKLPSCSKVFAEDGKTVALRGPRIRVGIHQAAPGEWSTVEHEITRQTVFTGIAHATAMAVADAANGGQILVTRPVADVLLSHMHLVQFPQLSGVGTFHLKAGNEVELFDLQPYESLELPMRSFTAPRNVEFLTPGLGAAVIRPPESEAITFVVVNVSSSVLQGLATTEANKRLHKDHAKTQSLVDLAMRKLSTCATQVRFAVHG